jgi:outer membrane protein
MKKTLLALAVAATLVPSLAMAEAGDIVVRLRATHISADESSSLGATTRAAGLGDLYGSSYGAELRVDSNTIPEIDFSYYITKNIAAELILAVGTRHDVWIKGNGSTATPHSTNANLGSVNLLPPTLLAQWHFNPDQTFDPYVGAGVSYVRAMDNGLNYGGDVPIRISRNSFGPAIQAGLDYNLENKWLLNVDVKKIWFDTKVEGYAGGWAKIDQLDVDPWVISVGFGKKF